MLKAPRTATHVLTCQLQYHSDALQCAADHCYLKRHETEAQDMNCTANHQFRKSIVLPVVHTSATACVLCQKKLLQLPQPAIALGYYN